MARTVQMVMIVPCELHTQAVMQALDEEEVRDWVVMTATQCRRLGEIGYRPPAREWSCSVVLAMADVAAVDGLTERLQRAIHKKQLCPDCLMYSWHSEEVPLSAVAFDPVCGMAADMREALSVTYQGTTYYFCSQECRGRFLDSPTAFAKRAA